jgi:hypothetical protein
MLLRVLAATLALVSAPAVPQTAVPAPEIPKVVCLTSPTTLSLGTAFRVGPRTLLSVKHVTAEPNCSIDGEPIKVTYTSPDADFSILSDDRSGPFLKVDCSGFVAGRKYLATGHARGLDELTTIELTATGEKDGQFSILWGVFTLIPGQSGGVITDKETGAAVGMINVYKYEEGLSGSVALRDTPLCRGTVA